MVFEIVAIERGEGKIPGAMLGDILRRGDSKQFEIAAVKLNEGIAGAEGCWPRGVTVNPKPA